jgi:hypothetical protein
MGDNKNCENCRYDKTNEIPNHGFKCQLGKEVAKIFPLGVGCIHWQAVLERVKCDG